MSRSTAQIRDYLTEWLALSKPSLSDSNVACSPTLELSPLDRPARRQISREAVWVVLERGGEFVALVGMAPAPEAGSDCFGAYTLSDSSDIEYSLWRRPGAGVWELLGSRLERLP